MQWKRSYLLRQMINADVEGSEAFASRTFVATELELALFPVLAASGSDGVVTESSGTAPLAVGAFFLFVISVLTTLCLSRYQYLTFGVVVT